jgi:hypothetical protein
MNLTNLTSFLMLWFGAAITPSFAATVEQKQSFGAFSLIDEIRTREPGEAEIMHVATEWTKLHLRWRSQDGNLVVNITDDGLMLQIDVASESNCSRSAPHQKFQSTRGEPALWQATTAAVRDLLRVCLRVKRAAALSYLHEMRQSAGDFEMGVEAMKSRSVILFGKTLKRCRPRSREQAIIIDPFASRCEGRW